MERVLSVAHLHRTRRTDRTAQATDLRLGRVGGGGGELARVGATITVKRYVDLRGATWFISITDPLTAESPAYRASKRTGATGGSLSDLLDAIDKFVADVDHKRLDRSSTEEGAEAEGIVTDADGSEWEAFYFKQQSSLEPDGQSGYYASRYGTLVGPSYIGTADLKRLLNRYADRVAEMKGIFAKGDADSRVDDVSYSIGGSAGDQHRLLIGLGVAAMILGPAYVGYHFAGVLGGAVAGAAGSALAIVVASRMV